MARRFCTPVPETEVQKLAAQSQSPEDSTNYSSEKLQKSSYGMVRFPGLLMVPA